MAKFRADVEGERYYPDLSLTVEPGDVIDLPEGTVAAGLNPVADKATKAAPVDVAPVTDPAPAVADAPAQGV